jgi:hypothetical protein
MLENTKQRTLRGAIGCKGIGTENMAPHFGKAHAEAHRRLSLPKVACQRPMMSWVEVWVKISVYAQTELRFLNLLAESGLCLPDKQFSKIKRLVAFRLGCVHHTYVPMPMPRLTVRRSKPANPREGEERPASIQAGLVIPPAKGSGEGRPPRPNQNDLPSSFGQKPLFCSSRNKKHVEISQC